jgi:hypothetical protein
MKTLTLVLLVVVFSLLAGAAFAQQATLTTLGSGTIKVGDTVQASIKFQNTAPTDPPIVITAYATYTDALGNPQQSNTATVTLTLIRPITVGAFNVTLPSNLGYVTGSANIGGTAVPAVVASGVLTLTPAGLVLNQQDVKQIDLQFKGQ